MTNATAMPVEKQETIFGYAPDDHIVLMAKRLGRVFKEGEMLPEGYRGKDSLTKEERSKFDTKRRLRALTQKMYGSLPQRS
ncbi:MAG: hypothetical protein WC915_04925 [archaeon]|jgi:hypothetical protein